ncbi:MAG: MFS transporter [Agathobacter sp.]|nr:MFS transporter [Agathobacter sp.]
MNKNKSTSKGIKPIKRIKRNELLLWFGGWTSRFGNIVFDYANSVSIVGAFAGKPWILALYQSSETLIQIVFNLIGGARADKGSRKRIVIITDILAAIICAVLSFGVGTPYMAELMIVANALLAIVYAFNSPTYKAIIRQVIEKDRIGFYNSISHVGAELIGISGPILGVGLVKIIGARGALIFDAITFVISALAEALLVRIDERPEHTDTPKYTDTTQQADQRNNIIQRKSIWSDILEGFKYIFREKHIFFLIVLAALVNFFLAGYNLLLPYTDIALEDNFRNFFSKALSVQAVGGILGALICSKIFGKLKDKEKALILFIAGTGAPLVILPLVASTHNLYLCLLPFAISGAMLTCFNIQFMSHVQVSVAEEYLGRVFSIIFTVAVLCMPLGSFVFAAVLDVKSITSFVVVGVGIVAVAAVGLLVRCLAGQLGKIEE